MPKDTIRNERVDTDHLGNAAPTIFNFSELANRFDVAFQTVRQKYPKSPIDPHTPKSELSQREKKLLKQFRASRQKEIVQALHQLLSTQEKDELDSLAQMLAELKPSINFAHGSMFTQDHPVLKKYHIQNTLFIREAQKEGHKGEWRVEILDPKPAGEGATGVFYRSHWVLKVKPQGRSLPIINDITPSQKGIKSLNPFHVSNLLYKDPQTGLVAIDDELNFAQRFTGKGQRYLNTEEYEYFLVLHRASGATLDTTATKIHTLAYEDIAYLAHQLIQGLANINKQGWVHADLKPENIMMDPNPHHLKAAVIDFSGCAPIGFVQTQIFGSPIIALPEIAAIRKTHPYVLNERTDSPSLAIALGILFGTNPVAEREIKQAQCEAEKLPLNEVFQQLSCIDLNFSDLFLRLTHQPNAIQKKVITEVITQLNAAECLARMTAQEALLKLEQLHPEFGTALWIHLQQSFHQTIEQLRKIPCLKAELQEIETLFLQVNRFVDKKNEGSNIQNPIHFYQKIITDLTNITHHLFAQTDQLRSLAVIEWCKILLNNFPQDQFLFDLNTPESLKIRMDALLNSASKIIKDGCNSKHHFLSNLIYLIKEHMTLNMPLSINMIRFIEQHYHNVDYTIEEVIAALGYSDQSFKMDALLALLSNEMLTKQQKSDLADIIISAVDVVINPEIPILNQAVSFVSCAIQTDFTGAVRKAIAEFHGPKTFFQGRRSCLTEEQNRQLASIIIIDPRLQADAAVQVTEESQTTITPDMRARDAKAANILIASRGGLLAPIGPMHYSAMPPALPHSPEEAKERRPSSACRLIETTC